MNSKLIGLAVACLAFGASAQVSQDLNSLGDLPATVGKDNKPIESALHKASSLRFDVRTLPQTRPVPRERVELEAPEYEPVIMPGSVAPQPDMPSIPTVNAPAPPPLNVFEGLDRFGFGAGSPPDTNGDVGPTYFVQTVNTSIGIFRKSDGARVAGFSYDTFMSQGNFGNLCDTNNFGDPVVLYDTFEDRWIFTDFAFKTDVSGNVVAPAFQCVAVSMNGDPVAGGWNYYYRQIPDFLNDYPKFGIWPDGLYMSSNMFAFGAGSTFKNARAWAFNKAQMYAGSPTVQVVSFDIGGGDFTVVPSNARLQTGTPPPGRPNLFMSTSLFLNAVTVYKFHVDWNSISLSTLTGPDTPISATSWPAVAAAIPQPGTAMTLDSLSNRAMVQNQYTNFAGSESLWISHTVRRQNATGFAAPRWYQVNVSGGSVNATIPQAATWDPDGANVTNRWMPSLALDRGGNLAMGYSTGSATTFPSIAYAGRLAGDPVNTFSKTEQVFFTGTASQTGINRWGDYSAMTLDPDGCTFWYTNEYANPADQTFDHRWLTKFGNFRYTECTPVGAGGTISGTVTVNPGGAPIGGATVQLGSRRTTTDLSGTYSFASIPAGTYPTISASDPGYSAATVSSIVVNDGSTTTQNFSLTGAALNACLVDTTQADFLAGVATNVDPNTSPGDVILLNAALVDQSNTAGTTTGTGFGTPNWTGQTFVPAVTGSLVKVDVQLFCANGANPCTGPAGNLTLSVRNTAAGLPTGADLASATIPGFTSNAGGTFTATFAAPANLTSGTQYALILRPVSNPAAGGYDWIRSSPGTYANGSRVASTDSGATWAADTTRDYNFKAYMQTGFAASGNLVSSQKDANPAQNYTATWTTLSWTASTPTNTALSFQVAASNSVFGPFNFVGPDNTQATFFTTNGASLSQFNGNRYLQYQAYLSTTNSSTTPTVNDVTMCFVDNAPADLSISNDDGTAVATAGGTVTYTVIASNVGPGAANNATVTDTFASGETCSWTCSGGGGATCTAAGSGNISDSVNLPVGGTATYTAMCAISLTASGSLSSTATISAASAFVFDTVVGNNSATDTDGVVQSSDLSITKTDGVTTATPGGSTIYTITASNAGPSNAPGSIVADTFPASLSCNWSCTGAAGGTCTAAGIGNINDATNLPAGGSVTYSASCTIASAAIGSLSNTATVAVSGGGSDPNPANNSATDTDTLTPQTELAITKTDGVVTATPGGSVTYSIVASNGGPSSANAATVADTFPAALTCTWTCAVTGSGSCTANGAGNINDSIILTAGSSATYTASCSVAAAATGTLSNTATIAVQAGGIDATPGDNSATDTDTLTPQSDLAISKTDGVSTATPGGSVTYSITASNAGPSNAAGANVADTFPASLTCTWTCVGAGGGTCTASSSGNVNDTINLPSGGSVTYTASCTIAASATGTLSNTATVVAPAGVNDPNPGNNSATDSDTLSQQADLAITDTDGVTTATPGGSVTYTITASNAGPSSATGATVADTFAASETCNWTCAGSGGGTCTAGGSGNISDTVNLPSGGAVTYSASCAIASTASGTLSNTATVTAPAGVSDPVPANNSATDSDTLQAQADIAITTYTDHRQYVQLGDTLDYIILLSNANGPSSASVNVSDPLPPELGGGTWNCVASGGASCNDGVGDTLSDTASLPVGSFVAYVYSTMVEGQDSSGQVTNTASATLASGSDSTPANNTASDTDIVVIFRDGFEGIPHNLSRFNSADAASVSIDLQVDAGLLDDLSFVPVTVAGGYAANGDPLFTVQLARFGKDVALRTLLKGNVADGAVSPWHVADMSPGLISLGWEAATTPTAGYLSVNGGGASVYVLPHRDQQRLTQLSITIENNVPWLVLIGQ